MRNRAVLVALAAASALLVLTGCVPHRTTPVPPTTADIVAYNQRQLDATRALEGLDDVARLTTSTRLPRDEDAWSTAVFGCLARAGYPDMAIGGGDDGYSLAQSAVSTQATVDQKVALYSCIAANPENPVASGMLYSASQRQYLWDYFTTWQIPCLRLNGYTLSHVPTRADFLRARGEPWAPYNSVVVAQEQATLTDDYDRRMRVFEISCGPRLGAIGSAN